ncbi:MAG: GFA family protein [Kofleriaceae bacterium]
MMTGRCLCGAVKFSAAEVETEHHACHCGMCRRWSSSAFLAATAKDVTFDGRDELALYDSSAWAARGFCRICGTTLFYFLKPTQTYAFSVGAFDDPTPFRLVREIFIDRKPPGYAFEGDHERWTEAETFERLTPK